MSFTSVPFALFAVLSVILYYTAARKFQWQFLLAASLFFYACSDIRYLIFIVIVRLGIFCDAALHFPAGKAGGASQIAPGADKGRKEGVPEKDGDCLFAMASCRCAS